MQTTCAVLTPRVVWCRATAPAGLSKLCQLLALSAWHFIAQGRSESSSKEQISARASRSEFRVWYQPPLKSLALNADGIARPHPATGRW